MTRPALLFCDEPVSALDVSNRNLVLNLLDRLRRDLDLAVVIIAHDLSSLAGIADRVAVFYRSRLVEQGPIRDVLENPAHPYTALLTASAPSVAPSTTAAAGRRTPRRRADGGARRLDRRRRLRLRRPLPLRPRRLPRAAAPSTLDPAAAREAACHVAGSGAARSIQPRSPHEPPRVHRHHRHPARRHQVDAEATGLRHGHPHRDRRAGRPAGQQGVRRRAGPRPRGVRLRPGADRPLLVVDRRLRRSPTRRWRPPTSSKVLLAHRPGFWAPTIAARAYATLDAFHPGRVAMHVITGGDDTDQQRDGDYLTKEERYRRTDDFLTVVRQEWESESPFDHEGEFYKVTGRLVASVRPERGGDPDLLRRRLRGRDPGRWQARRRLRLLGRAARRHPPADRRGAGGRGAVRPQPAVLGEPAADRGRDRGGGLGAGRGDPRRRAGQGRAPRPRSHERLVGKNAVGSQRLVAAAEQGDVHDKRLWTALAKVTGGAGNSTSLVGTYEQVAEGLLDYVDLGVTTLLIRGFDPLEDAKKYGRVIELVRAGAEHASAPWPADHLSKETRMSHPAPTTTSRSSA